MVAPWWTAQGCGTRLPGLVILLGPPVLPGASLPFPPDTPMPPASHQSHQPRLCRPHGREPGIPRDWCPSRGHVATGLAYAGGYVGDGVATAVLAGNILADLIGGRDTVLTAVPWSTARVDRAIRSLCAGSESTPAPLLFACADLTEPSGGSLPLSHSVVFGRAAVVSTPAAGRGDPRGAVATWSYFACARWLSSAVIPRSRLQPSFADAPQLREERVNRAAAAAGGVSTKRSSSQPPFVADRGRAKVR